MAILALDVGGSAIKFALGDEQGNLESKGVVPNDFLTHAEFIEAIGRIFDSFPGVEGIAISTCGELDPSTGEMFTGGTLRFNAGTNLIRSVGGRCPVPVSIENDANCALLAEMADGALAGCRNGVVLVLGTAVGGAIMIEGKLHHGAHFHSGNVSYLLNDIAELGSAILADTNGVQGLMNDYRLVRGSDVSRATSEQLFALIQAGDTHAIAALDRYCDRLSSVIFNLQQVLDAEVFAIGGGISAQGVLVERLTAAVTRRFQLAPVALPAPALRACRYHNDANLIGALRHHVGHPSIENAETLAG